MLGQTEFIAKLMVIGSGLIVIGQAREVECSATQTFKAPAANHQINEILRSRILKITDLERSQ